MDDYISTQQAANLLKMSKEAVTMAVRRGYLEAVKIGPVWAIEKDSVMDYKRNRETSPNGRYQPSSA